MAKKNDTTVVPLTQEEHQAASRAYYAAYRAAHRERIREQQNNYAAKYPDRIQAARKQYKVRHKEKVKTSDKDYRERHHEYIKAYNANRRPIVRLHYAEKREEINEKRRAYKASHPEQREKERLRALAYAMTHREEASAKTRAWYRAHRDKSLAQKQRWCKTHAEELRAYKAAYKYIRRAHASSAALCDLIAAQWREIIAAFDSRCAYCDRKLERLTKDHLTPVVKHGPHTLHNIVPACSSCNSKKNAGPVLSPVQPLLLTVAPAKRKKS